MGKVEGADAWLGDHMWMACVGPAGSYRVALHFTPRNLAVRPGYVPHFQVRFGESLVAAGDVAVEAGKPAVFERMVATQGMASIDLRRANGFPDNNSLRAESRPPAGCARKTDERAPQHLGRAPSRLVGGAAEAGARHPAPVSLPHRPAAGGGRSAASRGLALVAVPAGERCGHRRRGRCDDRRLAPAAALPAACDQAGDRRLRPVHGTGEGGLGRPPGDAGAVEVSWSRRPAAGDRAGARLAPLPGTGADFGGSGEHLCAPGAGAV